VALVSAH